MELEVGMWSSLQRSQFTTKMGAELPLISSTQTELKARRGATQASGTKRGGDASDEDQGARETKELRMLQRKL